MSNPMFKTRMGYEYICECCPPGYTAKVSNGKIIVRKNKEQTK